MELASSLKSDWLEAPPLGRSVVMGAAFELVVVARWRARWPLILPNAASLEANRHPPGPWPAPRPVDSCQHVSARSCLIGPEIEVSRVCLGERREPYSSLLIQLSGVWRIADLLRVNRLGSVRRVWLGSCWEDLSGDIDVGSGASGTLCFRQKAGSSWENFTHRSPPRSGRIDRVDPCPRAVGWGLPCAK